ncbi:hypothetical protein PAGU2595_026580 [Lysobacter xanthus]
MLSFLVLTLAFASAHASPPTTDIKPTAKKADDGVVCERKREMGSNLVKRICMTKAERLAAKEEAQSKLQKLGSCGDNENACSGEL